jgi:hypothetical protein
MRIASNDLGARINSMSQRFRGDMYLVSRGFSGAISAV